MYALELLIQVKLIVNLRMPMHNIFLARAASEKCRVAAQQWFVTLVLCAVGSSVTLVFALM